MAKNNKSEKVEDEPGAEDRFMSGVRKALATPPKPFTPKKPGKGKSDASRRAKIIKAKRT